MAQNTNCALSIDALLRRNGVRYATVQPGRAQAGVGHGTLGSQRGQVARVLLLADARGYALAVIPKNRHLDLAALENEFGRRFRLAGADDAERLFPGLPLRALPPICSCGQVDTYLEQSLVQLCDVFLETSDPRMMVRLDGESFRRLFYGAWCGQISHASAEARASAGAHRLGQ